MEHLSEAEVREMLVRLLAENQTLQEANNKAEEEKRTLREKLGRFHHEANDPKIKGLKEINDAIVDRYGNKTTMKDLLNISIEQLFEAVDHAGSNIISGPEQHNKGDVKSGMCAANALRAKINGAGAHTIVMQKDVVVNVKATAEKLGKTLHAHDIRTRYVTGEKGMSKKILGDEKPFFEKGTLVPVSPVCSYTMSALERASGEGLKGICLIIDEGDAVLRTFLKFKDGGVTGIGDLEGMEKGPTKAEINLFKLLGLPKLDEDGKPCGFDFGPDKPVRSLSFVSATHMTTILWHCMVGMPFKCFSMNLGDLQNKEYTTYHHLKPLTDKDGDVWVQPGELDAVGSLSPENEKVKLLFKTFADDVVRKEPLGYKGEKCMLMVAVTYNVNVDPNSTKTVMRSCWDRYQEAVAGKNAPDPVLIAVVGVGCVVATTKEGIPDHICKDTVRRVNSAVYSSGQEAQDQGGGEGISGAGPSQEAAEERPPKKHRTQLGKKLSVAEVLELLSVEHPDRPFILVGRKCLGRSVSVVGGDRVITHIIYTPGRKVPSSELSQLLMRAGGRTGDIREGKNRFMGGIKLLVSEEDYNLVLELYEFTQQVAQSLAKLCEERQRTHGNAKCILGLEDLGETMKNTLQQNPDRFMSLRSTSRPFVPRRMDPGEFFTPQGLFPKSGEDDGPDEDDEDEEEFEEVVNNLPNCAVATD